jgi:hypothetical protein
MIKFEVKCPSDIHQLMRWWFITLEPPYWYLRCRGCGLRRHLPWDARLRTHEAHELLLQHGRECDAAAVERDRQAAREAWDARAAP